MEHRCLYIRNITQIKHYLVRQQNTKVMMNTVVGILLLQFSVQSGE